MVRIDPETPIGREDVAEIRAAVAQQLDAHSQIRERVATLEEAARHFAKKVDVSNVKVWMLSTILGVGGSIILMLGYLIRLLVNGGG